MRTKITIHASTVFLGYLSVVATLIKCDTAKSQPIPYAPGATVTSSATDIGTIKGEFPAKDYKIVPKDSICTPSCAKPEKKLVVKKTKVIGAVDPCSDLKAKNKRLKDDIDDYLDEIDKLKKRIKELEGQPAKVETKVETKEVVDERKNYLYFSPMYAQDGLIATDKEGDDVYEAKPVERLMLGGGYTRFFDNLGIGIGGHLGENAYSVEGQIGVKF